MWSTDDVNRASFLYFCSFDTKTHSFGYWQTIIFDLVCFPVNFGAKILSTWCFLPSFRVASEWCAWRGSVAVCVC